MNIELAKIYEEILKEELVPAMGCTEPIALAYCASVAAKHIGGQIVNCTAYVCGNIIKNVKSVVVPNTGGLKGVEAAVAAGVASGECEKKLEVLSSLNDEKREYMRNLLNNGIIKVKPAENPKILYICIELKTETDTVRVIIEDSHTNITLSEKNGSVVEKGACIAASENTDRACLNVADIYEYAARGNIDGIRKTIERQIAYNTAIAEDGMKNPWGANIGQVLMSGGNTDIATKARAFAAAGSDARMSGCEKPVVIVSGSGNQGITASVPVVIYGRELGVDEEKILRGVILSDLITIHQKTRIGKLSAFCGAVSAGCGAAVGIAFVNGGNLDVIKHTIVNALAITSGMVCDGAKSSCAAKIASAIDAGILGWKMYLAGQQFYSGDGIVGHSVDRTIENVGRLAHDGMRETDKEILNIMTGC